jgi:hypothetical protein
MTVCPLFLSMVNRWEMSPVRALKQVVGEA